MCTWKGISWSITVLILIVDNKSLKLGSALFGSIKSMIPPPHPILPQPPYPANPNPYKPFPPSYPFSVNWYECNAPYSYSVWTAAGIPSLPAAHMSANSPRQDVMELALAVNRLWHLQCKHYSLWFSAQIWTGFEVVNSYQQLKIC